MGRDGTGWKAGDREQVEAEDRSRTQLSSNFDKATGLVVYSGYVYLEPKQS